MSDCPPLKNGQAFYPFTPKFKKYILSTFPTEKCISEVVRIVVRMPPGSIIIFHPSKL